MSIQVRNVTHIYNKGLASERIALSDISFDVYDGEILGIVGHTGSGKSTLLQHLNGLLQPDEGKIIVGDVDITRPRVKMMEVRRRVGLVFQYPEYQLFEETVEADVAFGPQNLGLDEDEIQERVRTSLELVGLDYESIRSRSPFELSGGQRRRVAIAGVVAMRPQVLILDEPTAGLDPGSHKEILAMIREIHKAENNIIIFVSHNMGDVAALADKVLVMDHGKVVTVDSPAEVFVQKARLELLGLSVPPQAEFMFRMKDAGFPVRTDIFTEEAAAEEICRVLAESAGEAPEEAPGEAAEDAREEMPAEEVAAESGRSQTS